VTLNHHKTTQPKQAAWKRKQPQVQFSSENDFDNQPGSPNVAVWSPQPQSCKTENIESAKQKAKKKTKKGHNAFIYG